MEDWCDVQDDYLKILYPIRNFPTLVFKDSFVSSNEIAKMIMNPTQGVNSGWSNETNGVRKYKATSMN